MAARASHEELVPLHLLLALLSQKDGLVGPLIAKLGSRPEAIQLDSERALQKMPKVSSTASHYLSPQLSRVFESAFREAEQFKDEYVSTEHLLLGLADLEILDGDVPAGAHVVVDADLKRGEMRFELERKRLKAS